MIYITDLEQLSLSWTERMTDSSQPIPYRDALNECVYELNKLINKAIEEELNYQQALAEAALNSPLTLNEGVA